jgi:hypothetical protein
VPPAAVRGPRLEHRVVREVVKQRVHANQEPVATRPRATASHAGGSRTATSTHRARYGATTPASCATLRPRSGSR